MGRAEPSKNRKMVNGPNEVNTFGKEHLTFRNLPRDIVENKKCPMREQTIIEAKKCG